MAIDPKLPIPIYFQLKTLLLEEILSGRIRPGERLPTEHELTDRYGISRTPVTRALTELAEEGVLLRHRRRGTFVNPHWTRPSASAPEIRAVVPEGPWEHLIREAAPADVALNVSMVPLADLHQVLTHAVAEGRAPDLAVVDSVWVPEFSTDGFLWRLEDLDAGWVSSEFRADFLRAFVTPGNRKTGTFAVPIEADVAGLWFHRGTLDAHGLQPPTTWEQLLAVGRVLKHAGLETPVVAPGGSRAGETTTYCLLAFLAANGVRVLEKKAVTLDVPATVEALRFLRRLVREGILPQEVVAFEWDRPIRLLAQGETAFSFGGSYEGPRLASWAGVPRERVWDHFGFTAMPGGASGRPATLAGGMAYAIFRQASWPELAVRLLKDAVSADALVRMSRMTGQIPPRRSAIAVAARELPFVASTQAMLRRAIVRPAIPAYPQVSTQLQVMLEAVLTGRLTPKVAARRAADMIGAITGLPALHR